MATFALTRAYFANSMISSPVHFSANAMPSFSLTTEKHSVRMPLSSYPLICDEYLGWFCFLAIVNSEAINADM